MNMAQKVGKRRPCGWVLAEVVDSNVRELCYVPVEGRHCEISWPARVGDVGVQNKDGLEGEKEEVR